MAFDFPASPTVGQQFPVTPVPGQPVYVWDGEKWKGAVGASIGAVRYDISQPLTPAQQAQARANINDTKKNYIINGGMQVSQEFGGAAGATTAYYAADCFITIFSGGAFSIAQVISPTPGGSNTRHRLTVTTAPGVVGATDFYMTRQGIEGVRAADLRIGTAAAKTVTLRFGVKAPAGTYSISFQNAAVNRSYLATYTIAAGEANTDVVKTVTVPLDQTGTWATDNTVGLYISWSTFVGTTYQTAAGAWVAGNFFGATGGTTNLPNGSVFELFDVALHEGSVAPDFQLPDYNSELLQCQRYWQLHGVSWSIWVGDGNGYSLLRNLNPAMRAAPTVNAAGASGFGNLGGYPQFSTTINYCVTSLAGVAAQSIVTVSGTVKLNARI